MHSSANTEAWKLPEGQEVKWIQEKSQEGRRLEQLIQNPFPLVFKRLPPQGKYSRPYLILGGRELPLKQFSFTKRFCFVRIKGPVQN